jgi:hypothetical protein
MHDYDAAAEHALEAGGKLRGQADFRRQRDHALAGSDGPAGEFDVDTGLAGAGIAVQQIGVWFGDGVERHCLFGSEGRQAVGFGGYRRRDTGGSLRCASG